MSKVKSSIATVGLIAAMWIAAPGLAASQDEPSLKGLIISHEGSTLIVRSGTTDTTVQLNDATKIRGTSGALGIRGEDHPPSDLIRGLPVTITTAPGETGAAATATEITFKNSDLNTAKQIGAGLVSTDERVAENSERIDNFGQLTAAGRTKVYFPVGSAKISEKGKEELRNIAAEAKATKGAYRLAVVGRADPTGNAAANQRLSEARARAVTNYLIQSEGVSPANFIPAAALGSAPVAQDPDPPTSDADARRVTVTIAVNKSSKSAR